MFLLKDTTRLEPPAPQSRVKHSIREPLGSQQNNNFHSPFSKVQDCNENLTFLSLNQNICCGYQKDHLIEMVLLSTQNIS